MRVEEKVAIPNFMRIVKIDDQTSTQRKRELIQENNGKLATIIDAHYKGDVSILGIIQVIDGNEREYMIKTLSHEDPLNPRLLYCDVEKLLVACH